MNSQGQEFSMLDAIAIVSFILGLANYSKNTDQLQMQDAVNDAVFDVHSHIKKQDEKLYEILNLLKGVKPDDSDKIHK